MRERIRLWARSRSTEPLILLSVAVIDLGLFTSVRPGLDPTRGLSGLVLPAFAMPLYEVAGCCLLLGRRRAPSLVLGAVTVHAILGPVLVGLRPTGGLLVAIFAVAATQSWGWLAVGMLVALAPAATAAAAEMHTSPDESGPVTAVAIGSFYVVLQMTSAALGRWSRRREIAHARDVIRLQEQSAIAAEQALSRERQRLARELHDIVAHSVTVMLLQAAGARGLMTKDPERAAKSLRHIEVMGGQAVDELRRMLGLLAPEEDISLNGGKPEVLDLSTLASVPGVVASARAAGLDVSLTETGSRFTIDPSVEHTTVRVIQEGLTNVVRHVGQAASVQVCLSWESTRLRVEVVDDGRGEPPEALSGLSTGHGLIGLTQRVSVVGGHLETAALPRGGFRLTAVLPAAANQETRLVATELVR